MGANLKINGSKGGDVLFRNFTYWSLQDSWHSFEDVASLRPFVPRSTIGQRAQVERRGMVDELLMPGCLAWNQIYNLGSTDLGIGDSSHLSCQVKAMAILFSDLPQEGLVLKMKFFPGDKTCGIFPWNQLEEYVLCTRAIIGKGGLDSWFKRLLHRLVTTRM